MWTPDVEMPDRDKMTVPWLASENGGSERGCEAAPQMDVPISRSSWACNRCRAPSARCRHQPHHGQRIRRRRRDRTGTERAGGIGTVPAGGGFGGARRPGSGISFPVPIQQPNRITPPMRCAKIQGVVWLEAVV
jgi:hypothetical protein